MSRLSKPSPDNCGPEAEPATCMLKRPKPPRLGTAAQERRIRTTQDVLAVLHPDFMRRAQALMA